MNDFDNIIWRNTLTLVEFYATWCGHCQALDPAIDRFRRETAGHAELYRIDIDDENLRDVVRRHHVTQVPTLIFFRHGEMLWRHSGPITYERIIKAFHEIEELEALEHY